MSPSQSPVHTPGGAWPLPSQCAGSYQTQPTHRLPPDQATSAQEWLWAQLQGGRSPSPAQLDLSVRKLVGGVGGP